MSSANRNRRLPFAIAGRNTPTNGFQRGRHHRAYIAHCAKQAGLFNRKIDTGRLHETMATCGYKNVNQFQRRCREWNAAQARIPRVYLEQIGCDLDTLHDTIALDYQEYEQALRSLPPRDVFHEKLIPAVWRPVLLPEPLHEIDAGAVIRAHQHEQDPPREAALAWPSLKTIFYKPDGRTLTAECVPKLFQDDKHIWFANQTNTNFGLKV